MKDTHITQPQFAMIWFGAALSIAEIMTGTYLAPLGLTRGLYAIILGHIIGGWPSNWNDGSVKLRKADSDKFVKITPEMLVH